MSQLVGRRIRELGLRNAEVARLTGLSRSYIGNIVNETAPTQMERVFRRFLDLLPNGVCLDELRSADFSLYESARSRDLTNRGTPVTPETIHREVTEISAAVKRAPLWFRDCEGWTCPPIRRPKLSGRRRERVITDNERAAIIAWYARPQEAFETPAQFAARRAIGQQFEFACLTSCRRKEVVRLKWTDYVPERDLLTIRRWKTGAVTLFSPLPARVREILEERRAMSESEYVFTKNGKDSDGYLTSLRTACGRLGIPYGRFTDGGLVFHDARHTFVTRLVENNVDLETARELAGLSRDMILRYAHSSPEKKRRAVAALDPEAGRERLKELFEQVRRGEIGFEDFEAQIGRLGTPPGQKK